MTSRIIKHGTFLHHSKTGMMEDAMKRKEKPISFKILIGYINLKYMFIKVYNLK